MAVTLTVASLKQPAGELSDSLFPDGDINTLVMGWLDQATTKVTAATNIAATDHDEAAAAWVYYRAYSHVAARLAHSPASASVDGKVSKSTASDQRSYFQTLAAKKLAEFEDFDTSTPAAAPGFFGTVKARRRCSSVVFY